MSMKRHTDNGDSENAQELSKVSGRHDVFDFRVPQREVGAAGIAFHQVVLVVTNIIDDDRGFKIDGCLRDTFLHPLSMHRGRKLLKNQEEHDR